MSDELLTTHTAIQANARRLVAGVGSEQWELTTPCAEWNVHQLVNHMAFTNRILGGAALGETPTFAPDDDHIGADPVAGFVGRSEANEAAWHSEGALDGDVQVPFEMPKVGALSANVLDVGIHCWDLASATRQHHGLTDDQVAMIDRCDRALINGDIRAGGGFGDELAPAADVALTSMLAFVGRGA